MAGAYVQGFGPKASAPCATCRVLNIRLRAVLLSMNRGANVVLNIIGGDFGKGSGSFSFGSFSLPKVPGQWGSQRVEGSLVRSVELVSQETTHHNAHRLAKGLGGAALIGPIGLAFGLLAQGKTSNKVSFVVELMDGRGFLATSDHATFLKIKALSVGSAQRGGYGSPIEPRSNPLVQELMEGRVSQEDELAGLGSRHPSSVQDALTSVESCFVDRGWKVERGGVPVRGDRFALLNARKTAHEAMVACTPFLLDAGLFDSICEALDRYPADWQMVVAGQVIPGVTQSTHERRFIVGELRDTANLIPA